MKLQLLTRVKRYTALMKNQGMQNTKATGHLSLLRRVNGKLCLSRRIKVPRKSERKRNIREGQKKRGMKSVFSQGALETSPLLYGEFRKAKESSSSDVSSESESELSSEDSRRRRRRKVQL